jgi:hypothetical protein
VPPSIAERSRFGSRGVTPALACCVVFVCVQGFGALSASAAAQQVTIDREVFDAARAGLARVLVDLRLPQPMKPEGELTDAARLAQRQAIAAAQDSVLAGLQGTHFSLVRRYETIPLILLEVRADAVTALGRMAKVVVRVRLDAPMAPVTPRATR